MIINGWLDWAIILKPTKNNTYAGTNQARGIFFHSAEGYRATLLNPNSEYGYNGNLSWHFSNMINGEFYQHYPITARCWHATVANFDYLGIENEGIGDVTKGSPDPTLYPRQVDNAVRLIKDISTYKGWEPTRPSYTSGNTGYTLWEHTEVTKLGGSGTLCPSNRIPWNTILGRLQKMPTDQEQANALNELAYWILRGWDLNDMADFMQRAIEVAVERMRQAQHE